MPVSLQRYIQSMQKTIQGGKKRMTKAVKLISKPASTRFRSYLGNATSYQRKNTTKVLKKTGKFCKTSFNIGEHTFLPVSWQRYLWLTQKTSKVLKTERWMLWNRFQSRAQTSSLVYWQQYRWFMQKNLQKAKKRTANAVKPVSKPAHVFTRILKTVLPIEAKKTPKC